MSTDPRAQAEAQLRRIEESLGKTAADVADEIGRNGIERHSEVVAYLKSTHGLTHGNANLLAQVVRERLAGGPMTPEGLLAAQYSGSKSALLPAYHALSSVVESVGPDVTKVVQKTGVSFRRKKQFALIQAASAKRIRLGLNLATTPENPRVVATSGMCTHAVDIASPDEVDTDVAAWIQASYDRAG
ncbi:MAG: DUF5655 domain-containing protein [Chloroflexota bacterium]|nr:DUF5655 domain-containing protein [Chloroflexota bacterium]MDE2941207.1 DUF5655 domain-containing protein [Chloroflexota bacterium]MDE3268186.1 DUF5655 domain-containing protein [Chloroflexota bacterium]